MGTPAWAQRTAGHGTDALSQSARHESRRNAFPAIWLGDIDVPTDQLDAVYGRNRPRIEQAMAEYSVKPGTLPDPVAAIATTYPRLPSLTVAERESICHIRENDCLSKVSAHREDISALMKRQSIRLAKDMAFAQYDDEWNDLPPSVFGFPPYGSTQTLWLTSAALDFVDGRTAQALGSVCTNALTIRRLHANNNTLVETMIAAARVVGGGQPADISSPANVRFFC